MANAIKTINRNRDTQFRMRHEPDTNTYYIEAKTASGRKYYGAIGLTKKKADAMLKELKKR